MAQRRNSGRRTGNRTANRQSVVDDDDDEDDDSQDMGDSELLAQIKSAMGRNSGSAETVALGYLRDIRKIRKAKNRWKAAYEELLEEMPEGSLVLVGDEANAIRGILEGRKLDAKKLADLLSKLETDLAAERKTNLENADKLLFSRVAEITGWDRDAVEAVARNGNQVIELKSIEVDEGGKKVKKDWPHVRPRGDEKAAFSKLDDYVESSQKYMWPSLKAGKGTQQKGQSSGSTTAVIDSTSAPRDGDTSGENPVKASLDRDRERAKKQTDPFAILKGGIPTQATR